MTVRFAEMSDLETLKDWGQAFHKASEYASKEPSCQEALERYLVWHIQSTSACILMTERGMIGAVCQPKLDHLTHLVARETFLYSNQPGDLFRLIASLEKWAVQRGAKSVELSALSNDVGSRLGNVLARKSYRPLQVTYFKEL